MSIAEFPRGDRGDRGATTQRSTNRIPPHSVEAEASLLGAMLLSREAVSIAFERGVRSDEFTSQPINIFLTRFARLTVLANQLIR